MSGDDDIELLIGPHLPPHVYIHVPFCRSKCSYCDFASIAGADDALVSMVFGALRSEVRRWGEWALPGIVETVYVGGGTPTCVAAQTVDLVTSARKHLPLRDGAEVTVEANPESLSPSIADSLAAAGTTRVSVGVQSFDDSVLRLLGRPHAADEAEIACGRVRDAGMDLSVDLMCGVPGQSVTSWQETLDRAIRTRAGHVSVYPLSLEEGTPLAAAVDTGLVAEPDPDEAADMMLLAEEVLGRAGLARYEVANYARPGFESRHNTAYWTGREYAGMGPSAHGMLDVATARALGWVDERADAQGRVRYAEARDIDEWLTSPGSVTIEFLAPDEAHREDVMLGLRLTKGVEADLVRRASVDDVMERLSEEGLVEFVPTARRWRATRRGWLLGNEIFRRVWTGA